MNWFNGANYLFRDGRFLYLFTVGVGIMILLFFLGFGLLIYFLIKSKYKSGSLDKSPLDILKERYAKGEISEEEYKRMKENLKD